MDHMPAADVPGLRGRLRHVGTALAVIAGGVALGATGDRFAAADLTTGDRPVFVSITPCRLADTRPAPNTVGQRATPIDPAETLTFDTHGSNGNCTLPTDAVGLSLNVTALGASRQTFLTIWPGGQRPTAASLNPAPGEPPTPNAVNVSLSSTGSFQLYNDRGTVHTVIDVNGYYVHHDHDDRYYTEAEVDALLAAIAPPTTNSSPTTTTATTTTTTTSAPPAQASGGTGQIHGRIMQNSRVLDPTRFATGATAIEIDPTGRPIVAFVEAFVERLTLLACDDISCSNASVIQATPGNTVERLHDMTLDAQGDPVFLYSNPAGDLVLQTCPGRCATVTTNSIGVGQGASRLTLSPAGNPIVGFFDSVDQSNKLVVCGDAACATHTTTVLEASTGAVGFVDVTIGHDGLPVVALHSSSASRLDVITCRTPACDGSPTPLRSTVDATPSAGRSPAIFIGADGHPLIAYQVGASADLKLARCGDASCSNAAKLTTVATGATVGFAPDVVIAATGHPVISHERYVSGSIDAVLIEICGDETCSTRTTTELRDGLTSISSASRIAIGANGAVLSSWVDSLTSRIHLTHVAGLSSSPGGWD